MEVVASPSQGRTTAAQCGLFTHKSVPVIFEPPCIFFILLFILRNLSFFCERTYNFFVGFMFLIPVTMTGSVLEDNEFQYGTFVSTFQRDLLSHSSK